MGGNAVAIETKAAWEAALAEAKAAGKAVIVDFTATWCGPCRMIGPYFDELAGKFAGMATFLKVDVDAVEEVAAAAGISAMPTFQVWKDGAKVEELVGAAKDALLELVQKHATMAVAV